MTLGAPVKIQFRVRYAETDQMGIAHHSNYFVWFEMARSELCRQWGLPYGKWEEEGLFLPVVEVQCRYKKPVHYDELITLEVWMSELTFHSAKFSYRLLKDDTLCCEGFTKHAFADSEGKLIRRGHKLIDKLKEIDKD